MSSSGGQRPRTLFGATLVPCGPLLHFSRYLPRWRPARSPLPRSGPDRQREASNSTSVIFDTGRTIDVVPWTRRPAHSRSSPIPRWPNRARYAWRWVRAAGTGGVDHLEAGHGKVHPEPNITRKSFSTFCSVVPSRVAAARSKSLRSPEVADMISRKLWFTVFVQIFSKRHSKGGAEMSRFGRDPASM